MRGLLLSLLLGGLWLAPTPAAAQTGVPVPTGLATYEVQQRTATFVWGAVVGATGYRLRWRTPDPDGAGGTAAGSWLPNGNTGRSVATTIFKSFIGNNDLLMAGTDYEFSVRAVMDSASSAWSPTSPFTTRASGGAGVPPAPFNLRVVQFDDQHAATRTMNAVSVAWSSVDTSRDGSEYQLQSVAGTFQAQITQTSVSQDGIQIVTFGFPLGDVQEYRVRDIFDGVKGAYSEWLRFTIGAPVNPVGAVAAQAGVSSASLSWATPTKQQNSEDAPISDYRVRWRVADTDSATAGMQAGAWQDSNGNDDDCVTPGLNYKACGEAVGSTATTYTLMGLNQRTIYDIEVGAENADGVAWPTAPARVTITQLATDASLSGLVISDGTLAPNFAPTELAYTASVETEIEELTVTPTASESAAGITVQTGTADAKTVVSGNVSEAQALAVGENVITVAVTALDETTTQDYVITVTRAAPVSNTVGLLDNLVVSDGTNALTLTKTGSLTTENFASGHGTYSAPAVLFGIEELTITPTLTSASTGASITVAGNSATDGEAATVPLSQGENTIAVVVTAEDSSIMSYSVTLTRGDPIGIKLINGIVVNDGSQDLTLTKTGSLTSLGFDATHLTYDIGEIENTVTSFTITADLDTTSVGASVEVTGADTLGLGTNTIEVVVRAQDDSTITYAITYFRNAAANLSKDSSMTGLSVKRTVNPDRMVGNPNPSFYPPFSPDITEYFLRSPDGTTQFGVVSSSTFTITPTLAAGASLPADFLAMRSVTTDMAEVFTMLVTAEDGLRQTTYTLNINLKQGFFRTNADLSALSLSAGTLSFDAATTSYDVNVTGTVDSLTVTATLADTAGNVAINGEAATSGTASPAITLAAGATTVIQVVVFAEDTSTMKTYTLNVARAAQGASTDATLSALALSAGASLNESFAAGTTTYTATVPFATENLTVTPTASDSGAVITVQGAEVASAAASDPIALAAGGDTVVTIAVLANDKVATQTYTLTITRTAAATDATLSALAVTGSDSNAVPLTKTGSATTAGFAADHLAYAASVLNAIASVTITPSANDSKVNAITVQGVAVASGATSNAVPLTAGTTTNIAVIVTAEDTGVMQTYTLAIARGEVLSVDANLSALEVDGHALDSVFASSDTEYSIGEIDTNITMLAITATTTDNDATLAAMLGTTALTAPTSATPFNVDISSIADDAETSITITVTPEDTTAATKAYVIKFTKVAPSTDNTLSGLAVSGHAFASAFDPATEGNTLAANVAANIGTLELTATRNDADATLAANLGDQMFTPTSGTAFQVDISEVTFSTPTTINIVVTAEDASTKTYTITFTRAAATAAPAQVGTITTANASGTIQISWAPLADASITSYQYRYRVKTPLGEWQPNVVNAAAGETLAVVAGTGATREELDAQGAVMTEGNCGRAANSCSVLIPVFDATPYDFQARAVNAFGPGAWAALTPATNQGAGAAATPGTPSALTITNGVGELGLSWSGTGTVTDHRVRWREATDGAQENPWLGWIDAADIDNSPIIAAGGMGISTGMAEKRYTLTNLTANTPYDVQIAAVNEASVSPWNTGGEGTPIVAAASDNFLLALEVNDGTAPLTLTKTGTRTSAGFAVAHLTYAAEAGFAITSVTVTATPRHSSATRTINGDGSAGAISVPLPTTGDHTITIVVTAGDTSTETYTVVVTRLIEPPSVPQNVNVAAQDVSLDVTWEAPAETNGADVDTYDVQWKVASADDNTYSASQEVATTTATITNLTNDTEYAVRVRATNSAGDGPWAAAVMATPILADAKNAFLRALVISDDSDTPQALALTPTFAERELTYTIAEVPFATMSVTVMPTAAITAAVIRVNGTQVAGGGTTSISLADGTTTITILVTATDGATTQTYTITVPRAAANMDATLSDLVVSGGGTLTKMGGAGDAGFAAAHGDYTLALANSVASFTVTPTVTATGRASITLNGNDITSGQASAPIALAAAASITVALVVTPENGSTMPYNIVVTRAAGVPSVPQSVFLTPATGALTVTWSAPADANGAAVTSYDVQWKVASAADSTYSAPIEVASGTTHTISSLTDGTEYAVQVRATNSAGDGAWTAEALATPSATAVVPSAPTAVMIDRAHQALEVSWNPPSNNGGAAVTSYVIRWKEDSEQNFPAFAPTATATSHTISGLAEATLYNVEVAAVNSAGEGAPAAADATTAAVPATPAAVSFTAGDGALEVSWTAPDDNGEEISGYTLRWKLGTEPAYAAADVLTITATEATIPALTGNLAYDVQVAATNLVGTSEFSIAASGTPTASAPSVPRAVSLAPDNAQITVSWRAPAATNGAAVSSYDVRWRTKTPQGEWQDENGDSEDGQEITGALSYTISKLTNDTPYDVEVRATNTEGDSAWSGNSATPKDSNIEEMTANAEAVAKSVSAAVVLSGVLDAVSQNAFDATGSFTPFVDVGAQHDTAPRQAFVPIAPLSLSEEPQWQDADWRELLGASSFRLGLTAGEFGEALGGGEWSVWGSGDVRGFNGGGDVETEGLGYSVYLGTDYRKGNWLAGIAAGYSSTTADVTADGAKTSSEFWLAGGYPYLRYSWQNQIDAWLLLGAGGGQLTLKDAEDASAFVVSHLYAAGAKANVLRAGRLSLAAKADVAANFALSVSTDNLNDFETMQQRVRVGVDAAYDYRGATHGLRPHLEVGARIDFGAGESDIIAGAEVAGGIRYEFQPLRLSVDARGRALVYDTTGLLREWGAGATIRMTPRANGEGISASLTPGWGAPESRADNMWRNDTPTLAQTQSLNQALSLQGELAYTFKHKDARITPLTQYSLNAQNQIVGIGTRLNLAPLSLELLGERIDHTTTPDDYRLRLQGSLRF